MLEAMTWLLAGGGAGHSRRGAVTVAANGGDARAAVAVIGAGIMGSAMARNLVAAGHYWLRSLASGMPRWPPGTAARMSAPPAWPWAVQATAVQATKG